MGVLRVYLALAVLIAHTGWNPPFPMMDSALAVQFFFLISGFYMALVLSKRYSSTGQFYRSRFLRIFPVYWIILVFILIWCLLTGFIYHRWLQLSFFRFHPFSQNGSLGVILSGLSNILVFGQDWIMFLKHDFGQHLEFTSDFRSNQNPLYPYLVIPQAWSVGVELSFYVCAPFINRLKASTLAFIVAISLAARFVAYYKLGLDYDPWTYRFFPFEMALFILGMLGYRLYEAFNRRWPTPTKANHTGGTKYFISATLVLIILTAQVMLTAFLCRKTDLFSGNLITYLVWSIEVGLLFRFFGNNHWDRILGELSFPIYLVHMAVLINITEVSKQYPLSIPHICLLTVIISVSTSVFIYAIFIRRWEERRRALIQI